MVRIIDKHETWDKDDGLPHADVDSGFHHQNVTAHVDVLSHVNDQMAIKLTVTTDDVQYYDERACDNAIAGEITLQRTINGGPEMRRVPQNANSGGRNSAQRSS